MQIKSDTEILGKEITEIILNNIKSLCKNLYNDLSKLDLNPNDNIYLSALEISVNTLNNIITKTKLKLQNPHPPLY